MRTDQLLCHKGVIVVQCCWLVQYLVAADRVVFLSSSAQSTELETILENNILAPACC
jgi:hypothetical protein